MNVSDLYNHIFDIALTVVFFCRLKNEGTSLFRRICAIVFLLPLLVLAVRDIPVLTSLRFFSRALLYFLYLYFGKKIPAWYALYYSFLGTACFTVSLNILLSHSLIDQLISGMSGNLPAWGASLITAILGAAERGIILLIFFFFTPFNTQRRLVWINWISILSVVVCEMYVKRMIFISVTERKDNALAEAGVYAVLLQVFIIAFVIAVDRYVISHQKQQAIITQHVLDQERLKSLQRRIDAEASIKSLHHDMKNHLLAIRSLTSSEGPGIQNDQSERIETYVNTLLDALSDYETTIDTGNALLDGLLSQKTIDARSKGISFQIVADFSKLNFMSDTDICTVFGNALDNAIEATSAIEDPGRRSISLKDEVSAGQLILYFINPYNGNIEFENDMPATKKDRGLHGIGLTNLKKTVDKYNGSVHIDLNTAGIFKLIVMLPLVK